MSHPLQIHSVTKYLLSRTCRDRTHRVPRFRCLTTPVQSTLVRRGGIPQSIGGVSLFTAIVTPLLLPISPDAITCTQASLPALSPLVAPKPSSTSFSRSNPEIMHEVALFYFITDRFVQNLQTYDAQKKLFWTISQIVDQQTGDRACESKLNTS